MLNMKQRSVAKYWIYLLLLSACGSHEQQTAVGTSRPNAGEVETDSGWNGAADLLADTIGASKKWERPGPARCLIELAMQIEALGWISDTARLLEVGIYPDLNRDSMVLFDDIPFYPLEANNNMLLSYRGYSDLYDEGRSGKWDTSGLSLLKKAKGAWAYFYKQKGAAGLIPDGVIEQWEFSDTASAAKIHGILTQLYPLPYFNTMPHYYVDEYFLYVFHARAMAFSYDQIEIFERFKQINQSIPTKKG